MVRLNFQKKLLLTDTQVLRLLKAFTNGSLANTTLLNTRLSNMVELGGLLEFFKLLAELIVRVKEFERKFMENLDLDWLGKTQKFHSDEGHHFSKKGLLPLIMGSELMLTNNEIKDMSNSVLRK